MSLENLEFELPRRGIVFKPETEMPGGGLLGFDADPNTASGSGTPGEVLLYNAPSGTRYIQKSVAPHVQWMKIVDTAGGAWQIISTDISATAFSRTYYDTAVGGQEIYPLTESYFNSVNASAAPRTVNNWSQFADGFWEIENFTTGTVSTHTFATKADFVAWKNANIPHGGVPDRFTQKIALRPFDIIDPSIPLVDRLYGMNNLYNSWRGGRMRSGHNHFGDGSNNYGAAVLHAIWAHFFPAQAPFFSVADFNTGAGGRKACWTSSNTSGARLYSMPRRGQNVNIASCPVGAAFRYSGDENWEGFNPLVVGDVELLIDDVAYIYVDESQSSYEIHVYPSGAGGRAARKWLLSGNASGFTAFKLLQDDTPGERQMAVLIKPMSIDRVWLPYFNNTKYDMEVVWIYNADRAPVGFRKINWSEFNAGTGSNPHPNSGMYLKRTSYLEQKAFMNVGAQHMKRANVPRIHFRFRDKVTGRVGPLSTAHIEVRFDETNAPVKIIVLQD